MKNPMDMLSDKLDEQKHITHEAFCKIIETVSECIDGYERQHEVHYKGTINTTFVWITPAFIVEVSYDKIIRDKIRIEILSPIEHNRIYSIRVQHLLKDGKHVFGVNKRFGIRHDQSNMSSSDMFANQFVSELLKKNFVVDGVGDYDNYPITAEFVDEETMFHYPRPIAGSYRGSFEGLI